MQKGLSNKEADVKFFVYGGHGGCNSISPSGEIPKEVVTIPTTTIDKFVEENNIPKVDFIKADIEGSERDMLKGAFTVLQKFAPKLAICTYHLPDDPEILENLILEANPKYKVVHLNSKLFAAVP